jgi:hypothetical protein
MLKKIDFPVQTFLIVSVTLMAAGMLLGFVSKFTLCLTQLVLVNWQQIMSLTTLKSYKNILSYKENYSKVLTTCAVLLNVAFVLKIFEQGLNIFLIVMVVVSYGVSLWFYLLAVRSIFRKKSFGSFLPHTSF